MDPVIVKGVIGDVVKVAFTAYRQGQDYFSDLDTSRDTVNALAPFVDQMMEYNQMLPQPSPEIQKLHDMIREQGELVEICPKTWWEILSFGYYGSRLRDRDRNMRRHLSVNMQVQNTNNLMKVMLDVGEILKILIGNFGQYPGVQITDGAPKEPECIAMEDHLMALKTKLLKDGVSVLVLTGLGGSGKSTLAKKICWDQQVKDKFGTNIFFHTFSETPNVKNIAKRLYEKCGCQVPEFQNNEDAINQLGELLKLVGRKPILLVLDDVWKNSEALVEKFKIKIPDYKILVTSRFVFERFGEPLRLEKLDHHDAVSIFRYFAGLDESSYKKKINLVNEIVKSCMGSPLALEVIGGSLRGKRVAVWQNMKEQLQNGSALVSTDLFYLLQQSLDTLEVNFPGIEKECFKDLGLFPEDQRIPVTTLIDMWAELHNLDEDGRNAMTIVDDFATRNLVKLIVEGNVAEDEYMCYNNHFIMLHDQLRALAAHQSNHEPFEQRKKLSIDLNGNKRPEWLVRKNEQGTFGRMLALLPRSLIGRKQQRVAAQVLSVSTDENFALDWCDMQPDEAEVLILNLCSSEYSLPHFIDKMSKLKVLIVTNYGYHRSELNKFELLGSLPDLKRIRLEMVSVPFLCKLKNLRKFSLYDCNTKQAFENSSIKISEAMPNLVEMIIDYCKDLEKLPDGVCDIVTLKKLSITNCHNLSALPEDIAKLKNLEVLRLSSCTDLKKMPESVKGLHKLQCLDITGCLYVAKLPDDIGELHNLEKLIVEGCSELNDLPSSLSKLERLKHVVYDEEKAHFWEDIHIILPNLNRDNAKRDVKLLVQQ